MAAPPIPEAPILDATRADVGSLKSVGGAIGRLRVWLSAVFAAVLGVLPHVLHHVGPLAGAALLGGVAGSLLFGAAGLLLSIPFLLRVHRRCGNWRIPAALLATFALVFSISTFVVGPAISGSDSDDGPASSSPAKPAGHEAHH
jgi:hypothetical protein